jgi:hypothetical protein
VVVKTLLLYTIMVTGCIWEKVVFDCWLFAPAFFWEDVFSMLVLALHTAYLVALYTGSLGARGQMLLALAAYATYLINATQFILKLRAARLGAAEAAQPAPWEYRMNAVVPLHRNSGCERRPCCANAASAKCSAASPASCGCTARFRMRSSWSWGRAPAPT